MMTYTTVGWITVALLVYAAIVIRAFCYFARVDRADKRAVRDNEGITRAEKMRVADRMREGRY